MAFPSTLFRIKYSWESISDNYLKLSIAEFIPITTISVKL